MFQSRSIRQCFGRLVDWKRSKVGVSGSALEFWSTGNDPNRRIRQCFGDSVDRKLSEVGVSGSASEGWLTESDPK